VFSEDGKKVLFHATIYHGIVTLVDCRFNEAVLVTDGKEVPECLREEVGNSELESET
jgi:hypothetical protein